MIRILDLGEQNPAYWSAFFTINFLNFNSKITFYC